MTVGGGVTYYGKVLEESECPNLKFTFVSDGTATAIANAESEKISGDIEIPARIKSGGKVYTATTVGGFEECWKSTF